MQILSHTFELNSGIYRITSEGEIYTQSKLKIPIVSSGMEHSGDFKVILKPEREMKQLINSRGYLTVKLNKKTYMIHRLVALYFIGEPKEGQTQVNHKDGNKLNNSVNNLEWCTPKENIIHAFKTGLNKAGLGKKQTYKSSETKQKSLSNLKDKSALTDDQVRYCRKVFVPRDKSYSATALALKFGVSVAAMAKIVKGETYSHVK